MSQSLGRTLILKQINVSKIRSLRLETGLPIADCKEMLTGFGWDDVELSAALKGLQALEIPLDKCPIVLKKADYSTRKATATAIKDFEQFIEYEGGLDFFTSLSPDISKIFRRKLFSYVFLAEKYTSDDDESLEKLLGLYRNWLERSVEAQIWGSRFTSKLFVIFKECKELDITPYIDYDPSIMDKNNRRSADAFVDEVVDRADIGFFDVLLKEKPYNFVTENLVIDFIDSIFYFDTRIFSLGSSDGHFQESHSLIGSSLRRACERTKS